MSCPALNEVTARDCADRFKQARGQFSPTAMFANGESRLLHPQRRETMNRYFEALEADELQSYTQISEPPSGLRATPILTRVSLRVVCVLW